jgi:hypothetical protein
MRERKFSPNEVGSCLNEISQDHTSKHSDRENDFRFVLAIQVC